ncbi:hypothetical protein OAL64_00015 [bacterium]|nr:hypothetical protein [bacterium]
MNEYIGNSEHSGSADPATLAGRDPYPSFEHRAATGNTSDVVFVLKEAV